MNHARSAARLDAPARPLAFVERDPPERDRPLPPFEAVFRGFDADFPETFLPVAMRLV